MNKKWYQSKTVWGFGLAGVIAIAQIFGVSVAENTVADFLKIITAFLGAYGLRDAM